MMHSSSLLDGADSNLPDMLPIDRLDDTMPVRQGKLNIGPFVPRFN
jgi:hypothetical protein